MMKHHSWIKKQTPTAEQRKQFRRGMADAYSKELTKQERKRKKTESKQNRKKPKKSKREYYDEMVDLRTKTSDSEGRPEDIEKDLLRFKTDPEARLRIRQYFNNQVIPYLNSEEYKNAIADFEENDSKLPHQNVHLVRFEMFQDIALKAPAGSADRREAALMMLDELFAVAHNKMTIPEIKNRIEYLTSNKNMIINVLNNSSKFKNIPDKDKYSKFYSYYRELRSKLPGEYESDQIIDYMTLGNIDESFDVESNSFNPKTLVESIDKFIEESNNVANKIDKAYKAKQKIKDESKSHKLTERYKFLHDPDTKTSDIYDMTEEEFQQLTGSKGKANQIVIGKTLGIFDTIGELLSAKALIDTATKSFFKEFNAKPTHGYDMFVKANELLKDESLDEYARSRNFREWLRDYNFKNSKTNNDFTEAVSLVRSK